MYVLTNSSKIQGAACMFYPHVLEMIGEMIDEDSAILSIYYGEEMNEDSANEIAEKVEEEYPDVEVEVHYGGQPIYYYVISVE